MIHIMHGDISKARINSGLVFNSAGLESLYDQQIKLFDFCDVFPDIYHLR